MGPDLSDWISQAEAARLHGVSRQAISKFVRTGRLRTLNVGGHVLVSRKDVLAFRPMPPGRRGGEDNAEQRRILMLLEACRPETRLEVFRHLRKEFPIHPLELTLRTEAEVILEAIERAGSLTLRMLRGVIAQAAFEIHVVNRLTTWVNMPIEGNPPYDFLLADDIGQIRIQVKLQRSRAGAVMMANQANRLFSADKFVVETQKTRAGTDRTTQGSTRPYKFGEFDILAVSMYPSSNRWEDFRLTPGAWLIADPRDERQVLKFQPVSATPDSDWTDDLTACVAWLRKEPKRVICR